MADPVIIRRAGHQELDVLDAADIPALPYDASGAAATAASGAASALTAHDGDTTAVHGIANTANLLTTAAKLDDLAAPDDNTDLNATTSQHGLLPKLGGGSTNFLRADGTWNAPAGGSGAPDTADYLVGTAQAGLSAEIVVGASPGGELGGTWAAPTVDATHSGSSHAGLSGQPGSTDVAVADGGTGASTAADARTNLGLGAAALLPIPYLPYRTGGAQYYGTWTGAVSGLVLVLNTMYCAPFFVPVTTTFTKIAVVATGVASSAARLGIYSDTAGVPNALVLDAGSVATTASAIATITISQQLTPGWYWLAAAIQGAAGNLYCNNSGFFANANLPASAPGFSMISGGYSATGISGALPSPWGATKTESARCPVIWLAPA